MVGLCTDCPNRKYCNSLCPEADIYANQDWGYLQELTIGIPSFTKKDIVDIEKEKVISSFNQLSRKKQVMALLGEGLSREEVAQVLGITRRNLREIVRRSKLNVAIPIKEHRE